MPIQGEPWAQQRETRCTGDRAGLPLVLFKRGAQKQLTPVFLDSPPLSVASGESYWKWATGRKRQQPIDLTKVGGQDVT